MSRVVVEHLWFAAPGRGLKLQEVLLHRLADLHDCRHVTCSAHHTWLHFELNLLQPRPQTEESCDMMSRLKMLYCSLPLCV